MRTFAALLLGLLCALAAAAERPRVGLVLSGGGARGLAHVGVLKVLEREGVVVDAIAGTSMGAIIGGLYASGMGAAELEAELLKVDWDALFASRVERRELSQRRKEEDFEIATALEIGVRDGELRAPLGALSGRGLETLLRRYTLPVREVRDFDALPIPFRAVATDMETGARIVLGEGDLALALRSSMSIPGVFAPTEVAGRILGDGGLVDNVPVEVARAMGADVLVVVNVGTPLAGRDALASAAGLTGQMLNILTEQNVQRSLATLRERDVLVRPDLGALGSADFAGVRELIARGEAGAAPLAARLAEIGAGHDAHAAWRATMPARRVGAARVDFMRFEGTEITNPARFAQQLETRPGRAFDAAAAERDVRRLAANGDHPRTDYHPVDEDAGDGVVFELDDKPWGPHYLRIGLDLSTDFRGASAFAIKLSHNRHWLDANGSEWRNRLQIGAEPRWFSEWYHPLAWTIGVSNDWFVAAHADVWRRDIVDYDGASGTERGRFKRKNVRLGVDLGQPWGRFGEVRLGVVHAAQRDRAEILAAGAEATRTLVTELEYGLRLRVVVDQLDYANFPQRGLRVEGVGMFGFRRDAGFDARERVRRLELAATGVASAGRHTVNAHGLLQHAAGGFGADATRLGRYTLGGFQQLSGYRPGQFDGNAVAFARIVYYQRRAEVPLLTRGLFLGGSVEAGNVWGSLRDASLDDLRTGASLFVGAETGVGPLYLGFTWAPRGTPGMVLFIGRP